MVVGGIVREAGEGEGSYSHGDSNRDRLAGGGTNGGGGGGGGVGVADEAVEAVEERPPAGAAAGGNLRLLDLILLLDGIDSIFALNIGFRGLCIVFAAANDVGNLLPVFLLQIPSTELHVPLPPSVDQHRSCSFAPAIISTATASAACAAADGGAKGVLDREC